MNNPIQEAGRLGQAIWLDYIRRGMLKSGEFQSLQSLGRTVMRIHFSRDDEVDILKLVSELN